MRFSTENPNLNFGFHDRMHLDEYGTFQIAKFVKENQGKVCPMNWEPDSETLTPGLDLVGKI